MPPLRNSRHEHLAQLVFEGTLSTTEIAQKLQLKPSTVAVLRSSLKVKNRVDMLKRMAADHTVMDKNEMLHRLTDMARADIIDYIQPDGEIHVDKDSPNRQAIAEYEIIDTKYGQRRSIKTRDPIAAMQEIAKMTPGMYVQVQPTQTFIDKAIILKVVYDDPKRINDSSA